MSRNKLNFVLDIVLFFLLLGLTFTGIVIKYVLPPGTGGMGRLRHGGAGSGVQTRELWAMTRHEWGDIHYYLAAAFIALTAIHIVLHWTWIKRNCSFKRKDRRL